MELEKAQVIVPLFLNLTLHFLTFTFNNLKNLETKKAKRVNEHETSKSGIKSFPLNYWVVIVMEFFERGSFYGMMSILSVYMTDQLSYTKESVGVIKSVIQPMLYILPILSGAIGDRFGYKRILTFAFIFLGLGYFLTSQTT